MIHTVVQATPDPRRQVEIRKAVTVDACTADEAAGSQQPTPLMQNRFSGQEINENGLNGVHKSAFEPVTSSQNKRRKLAAHPSSESDNNSQPHASEAAVYREDQQQ